MTYGDASARASRDDLVKRHPFLRHFSVTAEQVVWETALELKEKRAFGHPPYPPNDVVRLALDSAERLSEILDLRAQMQDLWTRAFEVASAIDVEGSHLRALRAALDRDLPGKLLAQTAADADEEAGAYPSTGLGPGLTKQAGGRRKIADTILNDWRSYGLGEVAAVVDARYLALEQKVAELNAEAGPLSFEARYKRLSAVLKDAARECLEKIGCLALGLNVYFPPVDRLDIGADGIEFLKNLVSWVRSAGRAVERLSTDRYTTTVSLDLTRETSFGNPPLAPYSVENILEARGFGLDHFKLLSNPRLVAFAVEWVPAPNLHVHADLKTIRINCEVETPLQRQEPSAPLQPDPNQRSTWTSGGAFLIGGAPMVGSGYGLEYFSHPCFVNTDPVGNWRIRIMNVMQMPHILGMGGARQLVQHIGDLRLHLQISAKKK